MKTLIVGATGATGRLLVAELLNRGLEVTVIVRGKNRLPESLSSSKQLHVIEKTLLDMTDAELEAIVQNCDAVASCLGHNISFKGIYGKPRNLVTKATQRLCEALIRGNPQKPVKFVLMNTDGNRNKDLNEPRSFSERLIIRLLRIALPPHADNEKAAEYLRSEIGQHHDSIEWAAVRPTTLIDEELVSKYNIYLSPIASALFGDGKVSRINVANFMADLIVNPDTWQKWRGQMPVLYNKESEATTL